MIASGPYDAVILAGGAARRLGGVDKPAQVLGRRALLDWVLDAVRDAERTVVVGPRRATSRAVVWAREEPPGSGPVAALAAGMAAVRATYVVVLAADLPFLSAEVVRQLRAAVLPPAVPGAAADRAEAPAGAVLIDESGTRQWLVGCWQSERLRGALDVPPQAGRGRSLHSVLAPLGPVEVAVASGHVAPPWYDCDTPEDLATAEAWVTAATVASAGLSIRVET